MLLLAVARCDQQTLQAEIACQQGRQIGIAIELSLEMRDIQVEFLPGLQFEPIEQGLTLNLADVP